jgi:CRP/FNR family transcriptional regulator, cyclic AMP receptor protein
METTSMFAPSAHSPTITGDKESDLAFQHRLELFELTLAPPVSADGQRLTDHSLCETLSASWRGKFCQQLAQFPPRQLQPGEHLYLTGNPARSVFLVRSGLIKTSAVSAEGEELTLRLYKAGDILGELCLCGGGRREEAVALDPSSVTELPLPSMLALLRRDPEMAMEFATLLCDRLADSYEQIESLSWDTVLHRLVRTLLRLAIELGEPAPEGTRLAHYIRQEELAQLVGARREVVSGLLSRLRASGHISYSPRGAITVQRTALQAFLDGREKG